MLDLQNQGYQPTLEELTEYVRNPVFAFFCRELEEGLGAKSRTEFSRCSWEPGWNVKFRKAGKNLCTVYPREGFFTALVVVGEKQREAVEAILPECAPRLREIYQKTQEGNGQRWLMIDLEDRDKVYEDTLNLIKIRKSK